MNLAGPPCAARGGHRLLTGGNVMNRLALLATVAGGSLLLAPTAFANGTVANPICPDNTALFNPGNGEDIVVPDGYSISLFKAGLNFPTGLAFRKGKGDGFEVY